MLEYKKIFSHNFIITKYAELNFAANFGGWIFGCHLVVSGIGWGVDDSEEILDDPIKAPFLEPFYSKLSEQMREEG